MSTLEGTAMHRPGRIVRVSLIALLAALAAPSGAFALPSEESCAASTAVPFSLAVPDALRSAGTHRFEWYSTFTNSDGTPGEGTSENQVTIDARAPLYPNTV